MDRIVGTIRVLSSDTKVFKTTRKSMYYYNRNGNKTYITTNRRMLCRVVWHAVADPALPVATAVDPFERAQAAATAEVVIQCKRELKLIHASMIQPLQERWSRAWKLIGLLNS